jgi:uncharacterized protein
MVLEELSRVEWLELAAGLAATGAVAGILAGLLGVGGGIVIVPVLSWTLALVSFPGEISQHLAVATSLATIIPTAISSARAHHTRGAVDFDVLRLWAPAIVLGALAGGILSKFIGGDGLRLIFGYVALAVAVNMALPTKIVIGPALPASAWTNRAIAAAIGGFSSLMGIGGGTLSVPTMTAFSVPIHRAVGTAAAMGLLIAVPGVLGFIWSGFGVLGLPPFSLGYVSIPAVILIVPTTFLFAPLGARLAHSLNQRYLRLVFALFLAITAIRMLWSVYA